MWHILSIFIKQSAKFYAILPKHIYIIIRFYEIFNEVHPLIRHMELNGLAHSP